MSSPAAAGLIVAVVCDCWDMLLPSVMNCLSQYWYTGCYAFAATAQLGLNVNAEHFVQQLQMDSMQTFALHAFSMHCHCVLHSIALGS